MESPAKNSSLSGNQGISIFSFSDFRAYLRAAGLPDGSYSHQHNNLKRWSKRLGYKSPSSLAMVLNGKRLPSAEMQLTLADSLHLGPAERDYFFSLVQLEKAKKKGKDTKKILERLADHGSDAAKSHKLSLAEFQAISEWYFLAIKNLVTTKDFREDPDWIRRKLRNKVTTAQVENALKALEECGALARNPAGKLQVNQLPWRTDPSFVSAAIRKFHSSMLSRALEAIEEQKPEARHNMALTIKFSLEQMPRAKQRLAEFLESFDREFFREDSVELYQMNLQLFSLTAPEKEKAQ